MHLTKEQSRKIQMMRGIAIVAVILTHCIPFTPQEMYIGPFVHFCVPTFLFLSGLLTSPFRTDIGGLYKKRLSRVLFPYILWSVIYTACENSWSTFLFDLLTGQCCSIYYYILVYIQLVLLTPLIAKIVRSRFFWLLYLISPVTILLTYGMAWNDHYPPYPFNLNLFFVWITIYSFGMRIRMKSETNTLPKSGKRTRILLLFAGLFLTAVAIWLDYRESLFWQAAGNGLLAGTQAKLSAFAASMLIANLFYLWFSSEKEKKGIRRAVAYIPGSVLKELGDTSFGIYLSHQLLLHWFSYCSFWLETSIPVHLLLVLVFSYLAVKMLHWITGRFGRIIGV